MTTEREPAFPITEANGANSGMPGMTLRDYFAAKAMQAWLVGVERVDERQCAAFAYRMAAAMLEARK